mmetsp:Transcript_31661/g.92854  ORF Transcript_31661/g.92854 Transcript_31661/m.92854 type:complete len:95 (+) Transcript_31661:1874-2158(+)
MPWYIRLRRLCVQPTDPTSPSTKWVNLLACQHQLPVARFIIDSNLFSLGPWFSTVKEENATPHRQDWKLRETTPMTPTGGGGGATTGTPLKLQK